MHFEQFDADKSDKLEQGELHVNTYDNNASSFVLSAVFYIQSFYKAMNMKYTTLAPTAQVASQQGEFLGSELSKLFPDHSTVGTWTIDSKSISPFKYDHAGVFAYLGNGIINPQVRFCL